LCFLEVLRVFLTLFWVDGESYWLNVKLLFMFMLAEVLFMAFMISNFENLFSIVFDKIFSENSVISLLKVLSVVSLFLKISFN
jgi:hypothetical protein